MNEFKEFGAARLLHMADALDAAQARQDSLPPNKRFTMATWGHEAIGMNECGTPACALGHYAVTKEAQSRGWNLSIYGHLETPDRNDVMKSARKEFGINDREIVRLFSGNGCGGAQTPREAANYIREFVFDKMRC